MRGLDRVRRSPVLVRAVAESPTPWADAWLAARMAGWALVLSSLKHIVPVRVLARVMWKKNRHTTSEQSIARDVIREAQVVRLAGWLSRGTNFTKQGACLQRSLLAYRYLSDLGADPRLMLAFHRSDGALAGHAWVMVDGKAVTESSNEPAPFVPVVSFGPQGRILAA